MDPDDDDRTSRGDRVSAFRRSVHDVVAAIPPGVVVTYGEVAAEAGRPGAARGVGRFLATAQVALPWWRVVTATGRLVPGNEAEHRRLLGVEGVEVIGGHVAGMRR